MMLRTTLAGLRLHKSRLVTTVLAIVLGVMFVAGTLVFTGTLDKSFTAQAMGSAERLSAVALPESAAEDEAEGDPALLTQQALDDIAALPEVADAGGVISGDAPLLDADGRAVGQVPTAALSVSDATRYQADTGELPSAAGEVALATATAEQTGFEVGDEVSVLDPEGAERAFTVTGLIDLGVDSQYSVRGAVAFTQATAEEMTGVDGFTEIDVLGAEGYTDAEVTGAVANAADGAEVITGAEMGERLAEAAGAEVGVLNTALMLFALVSVVVAGIVVYNTFAILLAQRQRELALLRCVGARRGQVLRGVLLEAVIIGLVASALGVLAGAGAGYLGFRVAGGAFDAQVSATALVVSPAAVITGLAVGTAMTVVAALVPAVRATRVSPLAALRSSAVAHGLERGTGWLRVAGGAALALISAGLVMLALNDTPGEGPMILVAAAGIVASLGVVVLGPLLVRGVVAAAGAPMRRLGVSSMLAADNARRNPKRAAAAMIALTVGATLITGYSVVNASTEETLTGKLTEEFPVDYIIAQQFDLGDGAEEGISPEIAERLEESPAVGTVITERRTYMGGEDAMTGVPVGAYYGAQAGEDLGSTLESGDLADLGPGTVAVSEGYAEDREVGDSMPVETERGERDLEIVAVVSEMQQLWGVTMDPDDFARDFPSVTEANAILLRAAEDTGEEEVRDAVYAAVADDPTLRVTSTVEAQAEFTEILDAAFLAVAAMLGLSILIAVFGIANTMALSVLERTRESALLRALGLAKGQLRRMLSLEAVLLCLIGAGVGIGLGVLFGWAASAATLSGLVTVVPSTQIAVFIGVAVLAGLAASILPARRAARASITAELAGD